MAVGCIRGCFLCVCTEVPANHTGMRQHQKKAEKVRPYDKVICKPSVTGAVVEQDPLSNSAKRKCFEPCHCPPFTTVASGFHQFKRCLPPLTQPRNPTKHHP